MKIVLLQNVSGTGKAGEIKEVSDGFALNSLIPQGKARAAKSSDLGRKHQKSFLDAKHDKVKSDQKKVKKSLSGKSFNFFAKADENGHLYGSINAAIICQEICRQGFKINAEQIQTEPLKKLGLHKVIVDFGSLGSISIPISIEQEK